MRAKRFARDPGDMEHMAILGLRVLMLAGCVVAVATGLLA